MADTVALLRSEPSPLVRPKRRSRVRQSLPGIVAAGLIGLIGLTVLAYFRFLGIGFVATDSLPLIEASRLNSLSDLWELFRKPLMAGTPFAAGEIVYRPFASVIFGLSYAVWGLNGVGYHVTNLALHVVSVLMVWGLLALLGLRWWSALIGAAVFALHPLGVVSVPIIARLDSIVPVTASTSAWVLLIVAERADGFRRTVALAGSVLLATLALLSKESAFVAVSLLPVLVAAQAYADGDGWRTAIVRCRIVSPYVVVAAVLFIVRYRVLGGMGGNVEDPNEPIPWDRYTQVLGAYTRDLTWSFSELASSNREVWPILAGVLLGSLGLGSVYLPRRQAVIALTGLAWLLGFAVFAMVFRIMTIGWLAYFALVGLAIVWAAALEGGVERVRDGFRRHGFLRLAEVSLMLLLVSLGGLGLTWLLGFAGFAMLLRVITIIWLMFFGLAGLTSIKSVGLQGTTKRLRENMKQRGRVRLSMVTSTLLLLMLGGLGLSWFATSPLVRPYNQWQFAGDISRQYVAALSSCTAASPEVGHVRLDGMPSIVDDGQPFTNQLGVTMFEGYTIEAALRLLFQQRSFTLTVWSRETLRDVHETMALSCQSDPTRVYLVANY